MSDIRGLVIQSRLDYMEKTLDSKAYNHILQKLSESARQAVGEQVFLTNLYPFHLLRDLDVTIGESINQPLETIFREIGKRYAYSMVDRYFFNYIESKDPQKFLAQVEKLYPHLWNFGIYTYKKSNNHHATVQFDYDEDIHKTYCWFMQEFLKTGVEICGGKNVELEEPECEAEDGESCIYQIKWNV